MAWKSLSMCSVERVIGFGGFGDVLLVRKHLDKQLYAIKTVKGFQKSQLELTDQQLQAINEKMQDEVLLLMAMNHPNIVRVFGHFKEDDKRYLVMEYCETDMDREIARAREEDRVLDEQDIYHWTRQLASAIFYLHKTNIRHDDIKPSNILLKYEETNHRISKTVRLTDFGLSGEHKDIEGGDHLMESATLSGLLGTVAYLSPDVILGGDSCFKRDVWAFGATVYVMTTLETLTKGQYAEAIPDMKSFKSLKVDRSQQVAKLKPDLAEFLSFVLNPAKDERPTMEAVVQHRFLDDLPRVFISYSWKNKENVLAIKDRLLQWKFDVWIDDQNMYGNITDGMAEAIEKATVVLLCFSSDYALSRNCKAEADYVFRLGKPFIPLKMESVYSPTGWLGIIIGNSLYYDFSDNKQDERFDMSFGKLVDALRHLGRFPDIISDNMTNLHKKVHVPPIPVLFDENINGNSYQGFAQSNNSPKQQALDSTRIHTARHQQPSQLKRAPSSRPETARKTPQPVLPPISTMSRPKTARNNNL